jgi:serine/threonine-protein kinase
MIGTAVGHIRLLGELARGGMGEVYVGLDEKLHRRVALKAIRAEHRLDPEAKARFLREARILSQLDHPNICRIHDYVEGDDADFLVLELIEGETLANARACRDRGAKLRVAQQIAGALAAAHERGIIHRDLKPGNVMLTATGDIKILDFGIASNAAPAGAAGSPASVPPISGTRSFDSEAETHFARTTEREATTDVSTRQGVVLGTDLYMSPEQARGEPLTPASDMYSFGLLLQELFTGSRPHPEGLGFFELVARASRGQSEPVTGLEKPLTALINRLKQQAPTARPTAVDAVERLQWIRDRRKRGIRAAIAAGVLLIFALGGLKYTLDVHTARNEAERRRVQAEDLIGFMLGDLREKLTAVGRLDALDEAGAKALAYFDSLPQDAVSDEELVRRAKALSQIGEVRLAKGDSAGAARVFEESLALSDAVAGRNPDRGDFQLALGTSHFWVGYAYWNKGDLDKAHTHLGVYKDIAEGLVARDSNRRDWQLELAQAQSNLGAVSQARGNSRDAIVHFQAALNIKHQLLAAAPDDPKAIREVAVTQSWLGEAQQGDGRLPEALETFEAHRRALERLTAYDPSNTEWKYLRTIAEAKVGQSFRALGRRAEALERFESYRGMALSLVAHDPLNGDWKRERGNADIETGQELSALNRHREAAARLGEGRDAIKALSDSDPRNADWRRMLASAENAVASGAFARSDHQEAAVAARRARMALDAAGSSGGGPREARRRSESYLIEGRALAALGRRAEAHTAWTTALDLIAPVARASKDSDVLWLWANALVLLDRKSEVAPVVKGLTAQGFRPAELGALCRRYGCVP